MIANHSVSTGIHPEKHFVTFFQRVHCTVYKYKKFRSFL